GTKRSGAGALGDHLRFVQEAAVLELDHGQLLLAGHALHLGAAAAQQRMLDELVLDAGVVQRLLRLPAGVRALDQRPLAAMQFHGHVTIVPFRTATNQSPSSSTSPPPSSSASPAPVK